jgi:mono/diheme cytochrome c family protein
MKRGLWNAVGVALLLGTARASEPAERGREALVGRGFNPAAWSSRAYQRLWRRWPGAGERAPAAYSAAVMEHYGLHLAPYPNGDLPMGLREVSGLFGRGLGTDCMLCHGGSIAGQSYVGLGNSSLDIQALFEDLAAADGRPPNTPFTFSNVRGTSEAGGMAVYLLSWRDPGLGLRSRQLDLGLSDDLCEDVPAWWLLKKKKTMYYTGGTDARSVRSLMQFMLSPLNMPAAFHREEATFADIRAYLLSVEPPKYPFPVDAARARKGQAVFSDHCARCHGTYGEHWTYPNKIVPIEVIGTDQTRFEGLSRRLGEHYNRSWFAQENSGWLTGGYRAAPTAGYQAPPLDGIWATAPYLHNGSVPTVYDLLNSKSRPRIFTRSYRTDEAAYDPAHLGWKVQVLDRGADPAWPAADRRRIYDTTLPGRGNGGHTFGDRLSEADRLAVIEYLKTL